MAFTDDNQSLFVIFESQSVVYNIFGKTIPAGVI